ncbi:MAG TPA: 2-amino-4-hydroxy-6-hydroxymethyldihydropteridine diphosphokinase [Verrucomicrobiae bacterium]|nr:2-amino-4-hydroxy-6-hydroxymethyldihydropteridine diphosphokinase [Verrucomicrobiae bacterium]
MCSGSNEPNPADATWAFIAIGSNLGNPRQNVFEAIERLKQFSAGALLLSSLWETTPVDCPPGSPPFINAVVGLQPLPRENPESLLARLQKLERQFGRRRHLPNAPRSLDLDLIAFGKETRATEQLNLPHPRAVQRRFVLQPLSEIAHRLVLPGQSKTVAQLLAALPPDPRMRLAPG